MWAAVLVLLFLSGTIFYALAKFHYKLSNQRNIQEGGNGKLKLNTFLTKNNMKKLNPHFNYALMKSQYSLKKVGGNPEGLYLFGDIINSSLYTFSMLLMVSLPKLPSGWSIRVLTGWYWLYCILVVVAYRASLTAILANSTPT